MKRLSIHTFMHVPFEGLGCIEQWITRNNHLSGFTLFYDNQKLPDIDTIDWLIVMGGPMGVHDEAQYPWLKEEKAFIRKAVDRGKTVIGICLGSQLIAEVLGAKVYPNHQKEIGWYPVTLSDTALKLLLFQSFEEQFPVFHWHGDTFDLPEGGIHLGRSGNCINQAFLYHGNVLGLQFHFEVTELTLKSMVENGKEELMESNTIQSAGTILGETSFIEENNRKMFLILDYFAKQNN